MPTIAVTGGTGFVGRALVSQMLARGISVRSIVRSQSAHAAVDHDLFELRCVGNFDENTDWSDALTGVDGVIHCAARAHVMNETQADALAAYRSVNVAGTKRLAEEAAAQGIRRLVYLSSIKVNGEQTMPGRPYTPQDTAAPNDPYGLSKHEAEQALHEIATDTALEVVIIRPPLVYGPGVKGNLARLMKLVRSGMPLPLGAVDNQRSLIALDNLIDLLLVCLDHPDAAGEVFLASDGADLSTPELLRLIAKAMGRSSRVVPVPVPLLQLAGQMLNRSNEIKRLVGCLQVDSSHTRDVLDWKPPVSVESGMTAMVQGR